MQAFDNLCACYSASSTQLVSIYGSDNELDSRANAQLRKTLPGCVEVPISTEDHPAALYFYRAHLLSLFLACLFDYWDEVEVRTYLLVRLEHIARHAHLEKLVSEKYLKKKGEARRSAENRRKWAEQRLEQEQDLRLSAERQSRQLARHMNAVHESHSWRLTSPLRAIKRMLSRKH